MKIAFITRTVFGALGTTASYMLPTCVNEKHSVLVLSPNDPNSGEAIVYENPGLDVIDIYHPNSVKQIANAADALLEFQPDIIHLFYHKTCHRYPIRLRHLFPHTRWVLDFRSPLMIFQKGSLSRSKLRWKAFFLQLYVDQITATSKSILKTHLLFRFKPFAILPFGINFDSFPIPEMKSIQPSGAKRFVYAGSIAKARRIKVLVRGFKAFLHKTESECTLDIYGTGNGIQALRRMIRSDGLEKVIRLKGMIPQPALFKKLCTYDVGIAYVPNHQLDVAPSLKALEFAAAGLPVIASDTYGHRSCNRDFGMKLMFFQNEGQGLPDCLQQLHRQGVSADIVATNREAVARFDWKSIVEKDLLPAYQSIKEK